MTLDLDLKGSTKSRIINQWLRKNTRNTLPSPPLLYIDAKL